MLSTEYSHPYYLFVYYCINEYICYVNFLLIQQRRTAKNEKNDYRPRNCGKYEAGLLKVSHFRLWFAKMADAF